VERRAVEAVDGSGLAPFHGLRPGAKRDPGWVLAESETCVRRLLASDLEVRAVLATPTKAAALAPLLPPEGHLWVGERALLSAVVGRDFHRGCVAAARRPAPGPPPLGERTQRALVLAGLTDPANVGAAIRNARAFGVDAVLVEEGAADPFEPRSIRASMGNVFTLPVWVGPLDQALRAARLVGLAVVAATVGEGATPVEEVGSVGRFALVVGHEGGGLAPGVVERADREVTVPLVPGADSLNVAAATAVLLHALRVL
jgi:tRNA G18 (ribose-2'-O)-methylase SpoU